MARFSFSFDRGIIRPAALLLVLCLLFAGFSGRAPVRAEDLYDDVYPEEEEVLEPLGPDSDENLSRFEQGLPTGLWYSELLADESREVWGTFWEVNDGVLYDTRFHALLWYPDDKTDAVYEVLPGTLYIAAGALGANPCLREIILPDGLKVIGQASLCGFIGIDGGSVISRVRVPASVELIASPVGSCVYSMGCSHPYFEIAQGNARYRNEGPLLIDTVNSEVLFCAEQEEAFEVTVPEGIRSDAPYAFSGAYHCFRVTLPEGLESIGAYAFESAFFLSRLNIPSTVTRIGEEAFTHMGGAYPDLSDPDRELSAAAGFEVPDGAVITLAANAPPFEEEQYPEYAAFMRAN